MSSNPYVPPSGPNENRNPSAHVNAPAIALMVVSSIAIAMGLLGLVGDVLLISSGAVAALEEMNDRPVSEYTTTSIRMIWGIGLIIASTFILFGAIKMKNRRSYAIARAAAIVAMLPLVGPCCILGIPFGIWAFITLGKPGVRQSFS